MEKEHPRARLYYLFNASQNPQGTSWLARLPASLFAIPFGLFGLVRAWRGAANAGWDLAASVASTLLWISAAIWAVSLFLYVCKCKFHLHAVLREFRHPVAGSLQALLPLSLLQAISLFQRPDQGVWLVLTLVALAANAVIALHAVSLLVSGNFPPNAITPALYLPIAIGALVGGVTLADLDYTGCASALFGAGLSGWALLEARVLGRLSEIPMPEVLRSTIGIEMAPPLFATMSAALIWPDLPAEVLAVGVGIAGGPCMSVLARYRGWLGAPFSLGFWAFSFPLAALASTVVEAAHRATAPEWIGQTALLTTSAIFAVLIVRTLGLLLQGKLLPSD